MYSRLNETELEEVLPYFRRRTLKKGEVLIKEGKLVTETFWVQKGLLISTYIDNKGKDHIIQFAMEGCWITDQPAFYQQTTASYTIQSLEGSVLLCLSFDDREKLCAKVPAMERFFRKKANDSFVKQQKRLLTYMTSEATERYHLFLEEYPGLIQRISKKTLASYLGVSRETLSRLRQDKK
ncbi:MAG TPA: Crp/Fnr family transcriptional regulator [Chitinophagaceae bacterium]|nr:Crp/Fnr family transcriptional regulator [Chitinophagaceae bacterium]